MTIGVPREVKVQEFRVGLVPAGVGALTQAGHQVRVERGAGLGSGYADEAYLAAGATLVKTAAEAFAADLLIKVKEPLAEEVPFLRAGQTLFTYLHLAANRALTEALLRADLTAIAYEAVTVQGHRPLLEPMSEIAGRMSIIVGAYYLARPHGGAGVLLPGVPGVLPGRVAILGGGTAGLNAARMALGLGAEVIVLEIDEERMRFIDLALPGVRTLLSTPAHLAELLPTVDLLIGAVLIPGARAPRLITRPLLRAMRPGSVFVDIAIDQGGCAETSRPTTHDEPVYLEEGVLHYAVANMPGAYARTATQALTNATWLYVQALAGGDLAAACRRMPGLAAGVTVHRGRLACAAVAEAHALDFAPYRAE